MYRALTAIAAAAIFIAACTPNAPAASPTPAVQLTIFPTVPPPTPTPAPAPIYLNLMWSLHQPPAEVDAQTGLIASPATRVAATRLYHDMAAGMRDHPRVKATFSPTPLLVEQLDALASGARDRYWELAAKPAEALSAEDRRFVLDRFFDVVPTSAIDSFPRYRELLDKRGGAAPAQIDAALQAFTVQDYRDLQVWFNLASFAPSLLAQPPLNALVVKGRDFSEDDKPALFGATLDAIRAVLPQLQQLQAAGQAEIAIAPYANAILPLLINTSLARVADPGVTLPDRPFAYPQDAAAHLARAIAAHERRFGAAPRGVWPGGGAVAEQALKPMAESGLQWLLSGEGVLARSLGSAGFERDGREVVQAADDLYRPYAVDAGAGQRLVLLFADERLGERIGAAYASMDPEAAAQDLIDRVLRIREALAAGGMDGPHLVTLAVDADSAWAAHADGGAAFREALHRKLGDAAARGEIVTTTPSAFLAAHPDLRQLDALAPGALQDAGFDAWIGGPEQNAAWAQLQRTRRFLEDYLSGRKPAEPAALDAAYLAMLRAEGADWLRGFGAGPADSDAAANDRGFRAALGDVYDALGVPRPESLSVPIIAPVVVALDRPIQAVITPTIDGQAVDGEWDLAGLAQGQGASALAAMQIARGPSDLAFRLDGTRAWADALAAGAPVRVSVYFRVPRPEATSALSRLGPEDARRTPLGTSASHMIEWTLAPGGTADVALYAASEDGGWTLVAPALRARPSSAATGAVLEVSAPLAMLGEAGAVRPGDAIDVVALATQGGVVIGRMPAEGAAQATLP